MSYQDPEQERRRKRDVQARRRKTVPWAQWYSSTAWRQARGWYLQEHPVCRECGDASAVIDHIEPHRGDVDLFWSPINWQPLCKPCHDRKTAKGDGGFGNRQEAPGAAPACSEDGLPTDPSHPWRQ